MHLLLFIDPACGERGFLRGGGVFDGWARALAESAEDASRIVTVCAPGPEADAWRAALRASARVRVLPHDAASDEFMAALLPLMAPPRGEPDPRLVLARRDYARGRGPACDRLLDLFARIRAEQVPFDLVLSAGEGQAAALAASWVGAHSARLVTWPATGRRWKSFTFVECNDTAGRSARRRLTLDQLRGSALRSLPAAVDQRLLGHQREVNPFESSFAALRGTPARAVSTERPVALVDLHDEPLFACSAGNAAARVEPEERADGADRLRHAVPRLLDAGWRVVLLTAGAPAAASATAGHGEREAVVLPFSGEMSTKRERRLGLALLAQADLIVTESSDLGLEALIFDRPVCVLGQPCYQVPRLFPGLDDVLRSDFNPSVLRADYALLRSFLFRCWGVPRMPPRRLLDRVTELCGLNERFVGDPAAWLGQLQRSYGRAATAEALREVIKREGELEPLAPS